MSLIKRICIYLPLFIFWFVLPNISQVYFRQFYKPSRACDPEILPARSEFYKSRTSGLYYLSKTAYSSCESVKGWSPSPQAQKFTRYPRLLSSTFHYAVRYYHPPFTMLFVTIIHLSLCCSLLSSTFHYAVRYYHPPFIMLSIHILSHLVCLLSVCLSVCLSMDGPPPLWLRNSPGTQGYYHPPFTMLFVHILSHLVCLSMDGHPPPRLRNSPGTQGYYHPPFTMLFVHILSHLVCLSVNGWSPSPQAQKFTRYPRLLSSTFHYAVRSYT